MELRFWTDAETGLPHNYDHGVTEDEVQQVLNRPGEEHPGTDHPNDEPASTLLERMRNQEVTPEAT